MVRRRPRCVSTPAKGRTVGVNRIRECRADAGQRRRQGGRARGERTHHHAAQAGRRDVESTEAPALALINGPAPGRRTEGTETGLRSAVGRIGLSNQTGPLPFDLVQETGGVLHEPLDEGAQLVPIHVR